MKLGVISPAPGAGCSWYRSYGPLRHLRRTMPGLEVIPLDPAHPSWEQFLNIDVLFLERPHSALAQAWVLEARAAGVKVWADYDDPLWAIPPHHPRFQDFDATQKELERILRMVDAISVSTPALAEELKSRTSAPITVIPNAVDETFRPPVKLDPNKPKDRRLIAWRGGLFHEDDIRKAKELLTHPDMRIQYFGVPPSWYRPELDQVMPWMSVPLYHDALRSTRASALVVPLRDYPFNRCKSNCSWLEATWSGLATIHATDDNNTQLPEFQKPGILTPQQWLDGADLSAARAESLQYVVDNLTLATVNEARKELLESLK